MMNIKQKLLVAAGAVLLASGVAQASPPMQPASADPAAGAGLYQDNCASCHGENLEGQPDWKSQNDDGTLPAPPHDDSGHTWHHGDGLLFDYSKFGGQVALEQRGVSGFVSGMPGFAETLSDAQIWDILAFIKSTWPARVQEMQATRTDGEQRQGG